jgi:tetratricopeptide (TPR) repeat protein
MMDNTAGAFKTLQSATEGALIEIGEAITENEVFKGVLEKLTATVGKITKAISGMTAAEQYNKVILAGLLALVPLVITAVGALTLAFGSLTAAMGPVGIAIAGVVLAYQALKKEVTESDEVIKEALESDNFIKAQENLKQRLKEVNDQLKLRREALERATNVQAKDAQQAAVTKLEQQRIDLLEALKGVQDENTESLENYRKAMEDYAKEQRKAREETLFYNESLVQVSKTLDHNLYPSQERVKELLDGVFTQVHSNNLFNYREGLNRLKQPLQQAIDLTNGLGRQIADGFGNAMANMVMSVDEAFTLYNNMVDEGASRTEALTASVGLLATSFMQTLGQAIQSIIAQLLAAVTVAAILAVVLSLATGGIAGTSLQSIGTAMKLVTLPAMGIPGLAEGGIVTGPTLALIGEGRESEAVIPLSKLPQIAGATGGAVEVYGRISGQDILLSSEKAGRVRTRYRGF